MIGRATASFFLDKSVILATFSINQYPLKNSSILDSGTTIHIFNNFARIKNIHPANPGDFVWAGTTKVLILGYGEVEIKVKKLNQFNILRLLNVAYCKDFACNIVSLRRLREQGLWWDNRPGSNCLRKANPSETIVAELEDRFDQFVLEYIPINVTDAAFITRRNNFNSMTERRPSKADATRWHLRLGHPGPQALEHLVNCATGVKIKGLLTVECNSCATAKARRQIRRAPRDLHEGPGHRLAVDFHDYEPGYGGFNSLMLITDRWSGYIWDFYLTDREGKTIIRIFKWFFGILKRQYSIQPRVIEMDGELFTQKPKVRKYLEEKEHLLLEPSAPYTQAQNGGAERSGGEIKEQSNTM